MGHVQSSDFASELRQNVTNQSENCTGCAGAGPLPIDKIELKSFHGTMGTQYLEADDADHDQKSDDWLDHC